MNWSKDEFCDNKEEHIYKIIRVCVVQNYLFVQCK